MAVMSTHSLTLGFLTYKDINIVGFTEPTLNISYEKLDAFINKSLSVMGDGTIGWIILVCGLFGNLIALLVKSGGAIAFGNFIVRYVESKKSSLMVTWLLEKTEAAEAGKGPSVYISAIPYMVYGRVAIVVVPLVALAVIPVYGPMKKMDEIFFSSFPPFRL